ncbi:DUF547 domain-containing protein [Erythrobacter sp.]|uniref:DUF547 domain-containing protein n=1 Tax=Erythrobacter sp. TaxID=1042 RepID=UPI0025DC740E|nr:DUF547 domain-containing protein [Erythrobacter sp.]
MKTGFLMGLLATAMVPVPAFANAAATTTAAGEPSAFDRFAPATERRDHRLDWQHWDEALAWLVIPMGPSIRDGAPRVEPVVGSRIVYGHESRYRLEGNRVALSFVEPEILGALSDYRADLERIGSKLDLARLPRNEQLAYWINLHNVAVIEALAKAYPLTDTAHLRFGEEQAGLHDAKLVRVKGVALSPRDIRERIVYPNWRDPKVIYGFWHGAIGSPSIQRMAYTGSNVDALLALSGEEFVNSLRGVEAWGGSLQVSPIYSEAAPFYFADDAALHDHLRQFAADDVGKLLRKHRRVDYKRFDTDLADMARGERDPSINNVRSQAGGLAAFEADITQPIPFRPNQAIMRLMTERAVKLARAADQGIRTGMVIYGDNGYSPDDPVSEVE